MKYRPGFNSLARISAMAQPSGNRILLVASWLFAVREHREAIRATRLLLREVRCFTLKGLAHPHPRLLVAKDPILAALGLLRRLVPARLGLPPTLARQFERYISARLQPDLGNPADYAKQAKGLLGCLLRLEVVLRCLETYPANPTIGDLFAPRTRWLRTSFGLCDD